MSGVTLPAHFDGKQIVLDNPYQIAPDAKLIVTILSDQDNEERDDWLLLSQRTLALAYAEDEVEYSLADIKEINPLYAGR